VLPDVSLASAVPAFIALWGGVRLGLRLNLYSTSSDTPDD
jgi:hypothetical protein